MLGGYIGQFLPLTGGSGFSLAGPLYFDSVGFVASYTTGNIYNQESTHNFTLSTTDANADANNYNAGLSVVTSWTLSGSNPSTDFLANRIVDSGSSRWSRLCLA